MKKLILILICLFVSFEVKSKEQRLICKSNVQQTFKGWGGELVGEIEDESFWIVVLNKKKKILNDEKSFTNKVQKVSNCRWSDRGQYIKNECELPNNELVKTQSWNLNIYSGNFQMSLYLDNNLKFMVRYNGTCEKYRGKPKPKF